jgi:trk system potassium uptake protein
MSGAEEPSARPAPLRSRIAGYTRRATPARALAAVRMAGTGVIAALGQLVVDMPTGYFGALESTTIIGLAYATAMLASTGLAAVGELLGWRRARWLYAPTALVGMAFFLPALAVDVMVAGSIIAWQLLSLSLVSFPAASTTARTRRLRGDAESPYQPVVIHLLALSIFVTTLVAAFEVTELLTGRVTCLVLGGIAVPLAVGMQRHDRSFVRGVVVGLVIVAVLGALSGTLIAAIAALGVLELGLLVVMLARGPLFAELMRQFVERPALLILSSFAAIALVGAVALSLPAAAEQGRIDPLDALFTAVSATCVTGLIVVDTPTAYSPFGQAVVLLLFQVGGLGIMVLSTFATVILGGRLTLRGERALEHVLELGSPQHAYRLVRFIVTATLGLELLGAGALAICYVQHGLALDQAVWRGVFQAVSAFCNAGFSLQTDSIVMFQSDPLALGTHAALIVFGGLGFVVLAWLWSRVVRRRRSLAPVQVRVVLWTTLVLIVVGTLAYAGLEWERTLAGLSTTDRVLNAVFQSITTRTAGFNSVDFASMRPATVLFIMVFMFIGAAPGGTGGGIKITTVVVLAAAIPDILGNRRGTTLFGRVIPLATLVRAASIAVVATLTMVGALMLLLLTEDAPFLVLAFEAVSALGTVGLSLGITGSLTATGKWVIIATMFIGRIGPLTLALALGQRGRSRVQYPETRIMVG